MIYYPAVFDYDKKEKVYNISFPDLPGCLTFGASKEEALHNAKEALTLYLETKEEFKESFSEPSKITGKNIYKIEPEKNVAFAVWIRKKRERMGMSQKQVAARLGVKYQTYQRYENPLKANPTLKTIVKMENIFNAELLKIQ